MKMHVLAATIVAALASRAAFADPETDFWQQPKPNVPTGSRTALAEQCKTSEQVKVALAEAMRTGGVYVYICDSRGNTNEVLPPPDRTRLAAPIKTPEQAKVGPKGNVSTDSDASDCESIVDYGALLPFGE